MVFTGGSQGPCLNVPVLPVLQDPRLSQNLRHDSSFGAAFSLSSSAASGTFLSSSPQSRSNVPATRKSCRRICQLQVYRGHWKAAQQESGVPRLRSTKTHTGRKTNTGIGYKLGHWPRLVCPAQASQPLLYLKVASRPESRLQDAGVQMLGVLPLPALGLPLLQGLTDGGVQLPHRPQLRPEVLQEVLQRQQPVGARQKRLRRMRGGGGGAPTWTVMTYTPAVRWP